MLVAPVAAGLSVRPAAATGPRPLGTVTAIAGADDQCPAQFTCARYTVTCPTIPTIDVFVATRLTPQPVKGMAVFFQGASGTIYWSAAGTNHPPTPDTAGWLSDESAAGYDLVQVRWETSWSRSAQGVRSGAAVLACRPATISAWILAHRYRAPAVARDPGQCGYCLVGLSGGGSQATFGLSHYGLDGQATFDGVAMHVEGVFPIGGPTHSAMDRGCYPSAENLGYEYESGEDQFIDETVGAWTSRPCFHHDASYQQDFHDGSLDTLGSDYLYPATTVHIILGTDDQFASARHAADYLARLDGTGSQCLDSFDFYEGDHYLHPTTLAVLGPAIANSSCLGPAPDTTPPDTIIDSGPSGTGNSSSATFTFHSSQTGSTFWCSLDMATLNPCQSGVAYSSLADGDHTFVVRAQDPAANIDIHAAVRTWTVGGGGTGGPPPPTIQSAPPNPTTARTATFTFSDTQTGVTFRCQLDGQAVTDPCSSGVTYGSAPNPALATGPHTFTVWAKGGAGMLSSPTSYSWTISQAGPAPETDISGGPAGVTRSTSAQFTFTSTPPGANFQCGLDASAYTACQSPKTVQNLVPGTHTFRVFAVQSGAQDPTPASRTWTVDTEAASSTITKPLNGASIARAANIQLTGTATDPNGVASVQVALRRKMTNGQCRWWTGSAWQSDTCGARLWLAVTTGTTSWTFTLATTPPRSTGSSTTQNYTLYSRATDVAGNVEATFAAGRNSNTFEIV